MRTCAIPEHLRGVITTRRYTNQRLPLPSPLLERGVVLKKKWGTLGTKTELKYREKSGGMVLPPASLPHYTPATPLQNVPGSLFRSHMALRTALISVSIALSHTSVYTARPCDGASVLCRNSAGYIMRWHICLQTVTQPSTNRVQRRATPLIEINALSLSHTATFEYWTTVR